MINICSGFTDCCTVGFFKIENNLLNTDFISVNEPTFNTNVSFNRNIFPYNIPRGECLVFEVK